MPTSSITQTTYTDGKTEIKLSIESNGPLPAPAYEDVAEVARAIQALAEHLSKIAADNAPDLPF